MKTQTILGAGGSIGIELAKSLKNFTSDIRLVGRNPVKINETDLLFKADLTNREQVFEAVKGSSIAYVVIGFEYTTKVWKALWPDFIQNVVDACVEHQVKLVFFDNVYAIGGDNVKHITEESPISPTSEKGEIRAQVDKIVLEAMKNRQLQAIIARAPDFFGPIKEKSMLMNLVYDNLVKGKTAQWLCSSEKIHSMGYTPELAKATALLGNTDSAYNQIWNLPTDKPLTAKEWTKIFAKEMNTSDKVMSLPAWGAKLLGIFVPIMGEIHEMLYQFDRDYYFDSTKFQNAFGYKPISNEQAVKETLKALISK